MKTDKKAFTSFPDLRHRVLVPASLFEGPFSIDWLIELSEESKVKNILAVIEGGVKQGLLTKKKDSSFGFKNKKEKKQFQSCLKPVEKKQLDRKLIDILLREAMNDDLAAKTVSNHLLHIVNDTKGCHFLLNAGDMHRKAYRYKKALQCYKKIIQDLKNSDEDEANRLIAEAAIGYSRISDAEPDTKKVAAALKYAIKRVPKPSDNKILALLKMHLAKTELLLSNFSAAFQHFEHGQTLVKDIEDPWLKRSATSFMGLFLFHQGRYKEIVQNYEESLPDVGGYPKTRLTVMDACCTGISYLFCGEISQGIGMLDALYNHYHYKGDTYIESMLAVGMGITLSLKNPNDKAFEFLAEATQKATEAPNYLVLGNSLSILAIWHNLKGDTDKAVACIKKCIQLSLKMNLDMNIFSGLIDVCCMMEQGEFPHVPDFPRDTLIKKAFRGKQIASKGAAYRYQALVQRRGGEPRKKVIRSLMLS